MSDKILLEVLTPEKQAFKQEVSAVYLQGSEGRLGILPQHTALIASLDMGQLDYQNGSKSSDLLCGAGIVEVKDNKVTVLVKSAERMDDININRAKAAMKRAKERRDAMDTEIDISRAEAALLRSILRLKYKKAL